MSQNVQLDMRVDRTYAHFHRVLGGLLEELAALPGVLWLTDKQEHIIGGERERNSYARAVYRVPDLAPYRVRLEELAQIQQQAMTELGLRVVPRELLLPPVVEGVTHVRLQSVPTFVSAVKKKKEVLVKIDTALKTTRKNLSEFQHYGGEHDEGVRRLTAEVKAIETVREMVEQAEEELYRVRIAQMRYRPYVYVRGEKPRQIRSRIHGLILVGPDIGVSYPNAVRQRRNDKRELEPLFAFGKTHIYLESAWQEAGR